MTGSNAARLAALATVALGILAAGAPTAGAWDGGTACRWDGRPIPDCEPAVLGVEADEPPEMHLPFLDPHGADVAVTCPTNRPYVWVYPEDEEGLGWDSHNFYLNPSVEVEGVRQGSPERGARVDFRITWSRAQEISVAVGCSSRPAAPRCDPVTAIVPGAPVELRLTCHGAVDGVVLAGRPDHGSLSALRRDGTVTYTPNPGYVGPDDFVYTAYGPHGTAGAVPVRLDVRHAPPACRIDDVTGVALGTSRTFALPCTGAIERFVVVRGPTRGTLTEPAADGTVTYTAPTSGGGGLDFVTFAAVGPGGRSATAVVDVQLTVPPSTPVDR